MALMAAVLFLLTTGLLPIERCAAQEGGGPSFVPATIAGLQVDRKNPFKIDFLIDRGSGPLSGAEREKTYERLVRYFLAALTLPNNDTWVNLSPYESDRIIPPGFSMTEMGRDLLEQDYYLKQFSSALTHPDQALGRAFWSKVYQDTRARFGTVDVPVDVFNKVWIVPARAKVHEQDGMVMAVERKLKVMTDMDHQAFLANSTGREVKDENIPQAAMRECLIPALEKEVNEGAGFAVLRQAYSAMLMATWFKKRWRDGILGQAYADKSKITGIESHDLAAKERIYQKYLEAFKKGTVNVVREEKDELTQEVLPRKYFSGGMVDYAEDQIEQGDVPSIEGKNLDRVQVSLIKADLEVERVDVTYATAKEEIDARMAASHGALPFNDFMEIAARHYYKGPMRMTGNRFDRTADFMTWVERDENFRFAVAQKLFDKWTALGRPERFEVVEMGPGSGKLLRSILDWSRNRHPDLYQAIVYFVMDINPDFEAGLRRRVKQDGEALDLEKLKVVTVRSWSDARHARENMGLLTRAGCSGINAVFFSNELPDDLAADIVREEEGILKQAFVVPDETGGYQQQWQPLSGDVNEAIIKEFLPAHGLATMEALSSALKGKALELTISRSERIWYHAIIGQLHRGFVITIDYGLPRTLDNRGGVMGVAKIAAIAARRQDPLRWEGLRIAGTWVPKKFGTGTGVLMKPGDNNITRFVDFLGLKARGENAGLTTTAIQAQSDYFNDERLGAVNFYALEQAKGVDHGETPDLTKGGIDFNEDLLDLSIERDAAGMPLPAESQDPFFMDIPGLSPRIIEITPVSPKNVPGLSALTS